MRIIYAFRNFIMGFAGQILYVLLGFASRTVFIYCLGETFLGVNGIFASVLSVLSFSELGLGTAILYAMYKPAADGDTEKLRSLLLFYRNAYRIVGAVILGLGLALIPALPYLVKGTSDVVNLTLVYVMYLLDSVSSYWFFSYKQSILVVHQKSYINSLIAYLTSIGSTAAQILVLLLMRRTPTLSFYVYTAVGIFGTIVGNIFQKRKAEREYPELTERGAVPLTREERKPILKNVAGLTVSRLCATFLNATDNLLLSAYIGVGIVGVYGNYLTLKRYVAKLQSSLFNSITAGVGNFCASESTEKKEQLFQTIHFIYFWFYGFCAICMWILYDSFIAGVWLHDVKWLLPRSAVFLIVLIYLLDGLSGAVVKFRDASGLYWQTKYRYVFSMVLNIVVSYVLMAPLKMGITGVLLGTVASTLIMVGFDPLILYKNVFRKSAAGYYRRFLGYLALAVATGALVQALCLPFSEYTFGNFLVRLLACLIVPNGLWFLLFRRSREFQDLYDRMRGLLSAGLARFRKHKKGE